MKSRALVPAATVLVPILCSCSSTYRMYDGSAKPQDRVAVLLEPPNSVQITEIDGKSIPSTVKRVELCPGPYIVTGAFKKQLTRYFPGGYTIITLYSQQDERMAFQAEAGHRYSFHSELAASNETQMRKEEDIPDSWYWDLPMGEGIAKWSPTVYDLDASASPQDMGGPWPFGVMQYTGSTKEDPSTKGEIREANRLMRQNEHAQAFAQYARAADFVYVRPVEQGVVKPPSVDLWGKLALRLWASKHTDEAQKCLARAFELDPKSFDAWAAKSSMLLFSYGHYDEALECVDRALELNLDDNDLGVLLDLKSAALLKLDRPDEAKVVMEQAQKADGLALSDSAIQQAPPTAGVPPSIVLDRPYPVPVQPSFTYDNPEDWYDRGVQHMKGNELQQAITCFDRVLQQPSAGPELTARAQYCKGYALYHQQQYYDALKWFDLALANRSHSPTAHYARGLCLEQLGLDAEARRSFEQAASQGSDKAQEWLRTHPQPSP